MRLARARAGSVCRGRESDLYAAIDRVTKKIEQQIRKRHNKRKARKHKVRAPTHSKDANAVPPEV